MAWFLWWPDPILEASSCHLIWGTDTPSTWGTDFKGRRSSVRNQGRRPHVRRCSPCSSHWGSSSGSRSFVPRTGVRFYTPHTHMHILQRERKRICILLFHTGKQRQHRSLSFRTRVYTQSRSSSKLDEQIWSQVWSNGTDTCFQGKKGTSIIFRDPWFSTYSACAGLTRSPKYLSGITLYACIISVYFWGHCSFQLINSPLLSHACPWAFSC